MLRRPPRPPARRPGAVTLVAALLAGLLAVVVPGVAAPASAAPATPARFVALGPSRLLDTRGGPALAPGAELVVALPADVPAGASAVVVDVVVTQASGAGYVSAWADGTEWPGTSTVNADGPGTTRANLAIVPLGAARALRLRASGGGHLVVDLTGAFVPASQATDGRIVPLGPTRVLDTRETAAPWAPGERRAVDLTPAGVPGDAAAAVVTLTAADAAVGWWAALRPGDGWTGTSSLNVAVVHAPVANLAIVPVTAGRMDVLTQSGGHLVVDVVGYVTGSGAPASGAGLFVAAGPARVLDTRARSGPFSGQRPLADAVTELPGLAGAGVPLASSAAVVVNVTVTDVAGAGFFTAWPARTPRPWASTLNATAGQTVANLALVPSSTAGVAVYTQSGGHVVADVAGYLTGTPRPATGAGPVYPGSGWLRTRGVQLVDAAGYPFHMSAVNWFGFNVTDTCVVQGLWARRLGDVLDELVARNVNTLRLPYSTACLEPGRRISGVDTTLNPAFTGLTTLAALDLVVQEAGRRGLRVLLDRHDTTGATERPALWYDATYGEDRWISDWVALAARYRDDPTVIGADLHNEPHGAACWGCGDPARDWPAAAERAGAAVLAANPNWLIVVEGVETNPDGTVNWWGGALKGARTRPVRLPVADRLVYSPHEYATDVYPAGWLFAPDFPANLPARWDGEWGWIEQTGTAPVLLGEFGTRLRSSVDRAWLSALCDYLVGRDIDSAYWALNPNSGDTGGLLGDDWTTWQTDKLAAIAPLLQRGDAPHAPS